MPLQSNNGHGPFIVVSDSSVSPPYQDGEGNKWDLIRKLKGLNGQFDYLDEKMDENGMNKNYLENLVREMQALASGAQTAEIERAYSRVGEAAQYLSRYLTVGRNHIKNIKDLYDNIKVIEKFMEVRGKFTKEKSRQEREEERRRIERKAREARHKAERERRSEEMVRSSLDYQRGLMNPLFD